MLERLERLKHTSHWCLVQFGLLKCLSAVFLKLLLFFFFDLSIIFFEKLCKVKYSHQTPIIYKQFLITDNNY